MILFIALPAFDVFNNTASAPTYCGAAPNLCRMVYARSMQNESSYSIGQEVSVRLKLYYTETKLQNQTNLDNSTTPVLVKQTSNLTAGFYPFVDQYTKLVIPNSYTNISTLPDVRIGFELLHNKKVYELPSRQWFSTSLSRFVEYRTVIITMVNGFITRLEWGSTSCYLSNCDCLDNICPIACGLNTTNCNVMVHLGWAGSDAKGQTLVSSSTF